MVKLQISDDSAAFRKKVGNADTNIDEYRKSLKRVTEINKKMNKAFVAYLDIANQLNEELSSLQMAEANYDMESTFASGLGKLVPLLGITNQLMSSYHDHFEKSWMEKLETALKNDFAKFDDTRKALEKAKKTVDTAGSYMVKLTSKKNLNHAAIATAETEFTSAHLVLKQTAINHIDSINEVAQAKESDFLEPLRQLVEAVRTHYADGYSLLESKSMMLGLIENTIKDSEKKLAEESEESSKAKQEVTKQIQDAKKQQRELQGAGHDPAPRPNKPSKRVRSKPDDKPIHTRPRLPANAVEKAAWVHKQGSGLRKDWKKRYAVLKNGSFRLYKDAKCEGDALVDLNVMVSNVKPCETASRDNCFQMIAPNQTIILQAEDAQDHQEWIQAIQNATMGALNLNQSTTSTQRKENKVKSPLERDILSRADLEKEQEYLWTSVEGNDVCADCFAEKPQWASINLGILVCIECSGRHRHLGTHLSKVRSFQLDDWDPEVIEFFKAMGNKALNSILERNTVRTRKYKPVNESLAQMRDLFIKKKYADMIMTEKDGAIEAASHSGALHEAARGGDVVRLLELILVGGGDRNWQYPDDGMKTALHAAAESGCLVTAVALVLNGADVSVADASGQTALHAAAAGGHKDILKILLKNGAAHDAKDEAGRTPMDVADGNEEIISILKLVAAPPNGEATEGDDVEAAAGTEEAADTKGAEASSEDQDAEEEEEGEVEDVLMEVAAVALYNCVADEEGELTFEKGDTVIVTDMQEDGWWSGYREKDEGKVEGIFPHNYVEIVTEGLAVVVGLYDYEQGEENELSFSAGDEMYVLSETADGWWMAMLDGVCGRIPANYVGSGG